MIIRFLVLALLLLFPLVMLSNADFASASSSDTWIHTYERTNKDRAESLVQCSDGGYVIAGNTNISSDPPRSQLWLLKTDALGNAEWNKTYGSSGSAQGRCVIQTSDGGYALVGYSNSFSGDGSYQVWLIKLAAEHRTWIVDDDGPADFHTIQEAIVTAPRVYQPNPSKRI